MLNTKEIDDLALLARLAVSEAEKKNLTRDLEKILAYVSELSELGGVTLTPTKTDRQPPPVFIPGPAGWRDDALVIPALLEGKLLAVPAVWDDRGDSKNSK